ncbi:hypothetical protein T440DRAFT_484946 [Plenodomus tracheiphilus IPT5]|uniref:Inner kinetochore subunit AME1 domain-containing protein n=1 Tax=Plenodomus tracheiphilus IPT5 TaxID=1408161 RepID=A0A6A7BQE7_9PLEO|nr:hypothetical protein T440DRAFT_484946 [Plenodomus tracheiphilus IPT5]
MNLDRHERRQQRVRGAGPSSVQASFGFNFGALGAGPAKQTALPPQRSSRRTPTINTPRGAHGSAKRHRSASVQRSSGANRRSTPSNRNQTPQLGKRKRDSVSAQAGAAEEEIDELSPDREDNVPSVEKSRKHARTISPPSEEQYGEPDELSILQEEPDELSILQDGANMVQKAILNTPAASKSTPISHAVKKRTPPGSTLRNTPNVYRSDARLVTLQRSLPRRSKSADLGPATPETYLDGRPSRLSAAPSGKNPATPTAAPVDEDSEDELSPSHITESTPLVEQQKPSALHEVEVEADELSSPLQPISGHISVVAPLKKRGRPRRVVEEAEDEALQAAPVGFEPPKRGRPKKAFETQPEEVQATPAPHKSGKRKPMNAPVEEEIEEELDELSPDSGKTKQRSSTFPGAIEEVPELSDAADSDEDEEPEPVETPDPSPVPLRKRQSPKQAPNVKPSSELPARKRQKFSGPKHAISVMRIKGSTVRGITVADTARTILEETINHRLSRMADKLQTSKDSVQRKELRSCINLTLSFKESLDEKLLDLQDANDVLSTGFKKMKIFKRDNADLRKEILTLQNSRQEIALEHDDIQVEFDAQKDETETRNTLSANMYAIEAAVRKGREKARQEGREDEGPQVPLSMMIDNVGRDVGSFGGGLLDHVKGFNGLLERAAGWLEGRA